MKDRHRYIAADAQLLKTIYREVDERFVPDMGRFRITIWTKLAVYLLASVLFYSALYVPTSSGVFILIFVGYGMSTLLFAFNFSHDFSHNTIFRNKSANNLCFIAMYTIVGAHAEAWKHRHIHSHHYAPNVEDYDSDLNITDLIRVIPGSNFRSYHRFQHVYAPFAYMTYSLYWVFIKDFILLFKNDDHSTVSKGFRYHVSFWIQKFIYLAITLALPLTFAPQSWIAVIAGFVIMHLVQSFFLLFTFFMTHHVESTAYPTTDRDGTISASWVMNQIGSSNDMHPFSLTANFILGGFNNHIAHHLFPHIHHIHYPSINRILYDILRRHQIEPNQTTYLGGIMSHLRLLKKMGRN